MLAALERTAAFALYQISLLLALVLLPVAVLARQGGLTLPMGRVVDRTRRTYAATRDGR